MYSKLPTILYIWKDVLFLAWCLFFSFFFSCTYQGNHTFIALYRSSNAGFEWILVLVGGNPGLINVIIESNSWASKPNGCIFYSCNFSQSSEEKSLGIATQITETVTVTQLNLWLFFDCITVACLLSCRAWVMLQKRVRRRRGMRFGNRVWGNTGASIWWKREKH